MPQASDATWMLLAQTLLTITAFVAVVGALAASIRELAGGYWIFGWAALILAGAFFLLVDAGYAWAIHPAYLADALFPPLMYLGACELAGRKSTLRWLALGLGVGTLRCGFEIVDWHLGLGLVNFGYAPVLLVATARAVHSAPHDAPFRLPIVTLLLAWVGVEAWDGWLDWRTGVNQVPWRLLVLVCTPLASLQVASRFASVQSGLVRAQLASDEAERQRDLERWRFHSLFDNVNELIAELDADTRVYFVNERARDLLGLDPETLVGRVAIEYVPEPLRAQAEELWRLQLKGELDPVVFPLIDKHGRPLHLEIAVSDYGSADERRLLVIARDTTRRQLAEQALIRDREALEVRVAERTEQLAASLRRLREQERLAEIGTLAAGIAHQINNPIGAIAVAGEFALAAGDQDDATVIRGEALTRIVDEAHRAGRIVKSVLRFARHGSTPKWSEDLVALVRRATELARPYVTKRGGSLELSGESGAVPVVLSPIEIEQVVVNLVHNAAESRVTGARVRVWTGVVYDRACIEIEDDGRGIDAATRARIFDPFYTTRLREGGSGLGLSVAHGIAVDHGGEIEIESELGRGTIVRVWLPLAARPAMSAARSDEQVGEGA